MNQEIINRLQVNSDIEQLFKDCNCKLVTINTINDIKSGKFDSNKLKISVEYDLIYQKLYIGPYHEVPDKFRKLFVILSILKSFIASKESSDLQDSLFVADLGIIIGAELEECDLLKELAENLHRSIGKMHSGFLKFT